MVFTGEVKAQEWLLQDTEGNKYASHFPDGVPRLTTYHADKRVTESEAPPDILEAAGMSGANGSGYGTGHGGRNSAPAGDERAIEDANPFDALDRELGGEDGEEEAPTAFKIGSHTLYARKIDVVGGFQVAALSARTKFGELDFANEEQMRAWMVAVFQTCVTVDPAGLVPFFSRSQAWSWVKSKKPPKVQACQVILSACILKNPSLIGKEELSDSDRAALKEHEKKRNERWLGFNWRRASLMELVEFVASEWLLTHDFHRKALYIAGKLGGGDYQWRYFVGDPDIIEKVARGFAFFGAYYQLPENQPALTRDDLYHLVEMIFSGK